MFLLARQVLFWIFQAMFCFNECSQGNELSEEDLKYQIIHPDFIVNQINNPGIRRVGFIENLRQDLSLHRSIQIARREVYALKPLTDEQKRQLDANKQFLRTLAIESVLGQCVICTLEMEPGKTGRKIMQMSCNPSHAMHADPCFEEYEKHLKKQNKPVTCPICRQTLHKEMCQIVDQFDPTKSMALSKSGAKLAPPKPKLEVDVMPPQGQAVEFIRASPSQVVPSVPELPRPEVDPEFERDDFPV
jgi:hypothetical protein